MAMASDKMQIHQYIERFEELQLTQSESTETYRSQSVSIEIPAQIRLIEVIGRAKKLMGQ
jgi:hypothetical protein